MQLNADHKICIFSAQCPLFRLVDLLVEISLSSLQSSETTQISVPVFVCRVDFVKSKFGTDIEAAFLDLNLSIHNDIVSTKIYDKRGEILILLIFRSLTAMSLNVPLMVHIYLNLFALPEHLRMLLTSIIVTNS